jgi:hypothetical protein
MTYDQLLLKLNNEFGLEEWPTTYEVDVETYGYACQAIFNKIEKERIMFWDVVIDGKQRPDIEVVTITIGPHNGIMLKNVELIITQTKESL